MVPITTSLGVEQLEEMHCTSEARVVCCQKKLMFLIYNHMYQLSSVGLNATVTQYYFATNWQPWIFIFFLQFDIWLHITHTVVFVAILSVHWKLRTRQTLGFIRSTWLSYNISSPLMIWPDDTVNPLLYDGSKYKHFAGEQTFMENWISYHTTLEGNLQEFRSCE